MINNVKKDLNQLLSDLNEINIKKTELESKLKEELTDVKRVRLLNIDNNIFTIYLRYDTVCDNIKEIAEELDYKLDHTFKSKNKGYMYRLTPQKNIR